ncbi:MAG: CatB-related O-acetyltransferase [Candidatus Micrarchaeota archaeon]
MISPNTLITSLDHQINLSAIGSPFNHLARNFSISNEEEKIIKKKAVKIGNNVWLAQNAIVLPGVTIGNGAVIGANAVVTKNVPPFTIAVGVPAKVVKFRFSKNVIRQLQKIKWWDWPEDKLKRNELFFSTDLTTFKGKIDKLIKD